MGWPLPCRQVSWWSCTPSGSAVRTRAPAPVRQYSVFCSTWPGILQVRRLRLCPPPPHTHTHHFASCLGIVTERNATDEKRIRLGRAPHEYTPPSPMYTYKIGNYLEKRRNVSEIGTIFWTSLIPQYLSDIPLKEIVHLQHGVLNWDSHIVASVKQPLNSESFAWKHFLAEEIGFFRDENRFDRFFRFYPFLQWLADVQNSRTWLADEVAWYGLSFW